MLEIYICLKPGVLTPFSRGTQKRYSGSKIEKQNKKPCSQSELPREAIGPELCPHLSLLPEVADHTQVGRLHLFSCSLSPAVGSTPQITREVLKDGGTQLRCTSDGWFPRPHVQWRDRDGRTLPSFSEAFRQGSQELFQVETLLLVTNGSMVNVTCSISLPLGEEKTARFPLSGW